MEKGTGQGYFSDVFVRTTSMRDASMIKNDTRNDGRWHVNNIRGVKPNTRTMHFYFEVCLLAGAFELLIRRGSPELLLALFTVRNRY